ncbi:MAG: response regulator transcription factor [Bacteroidales bacterium]|nr:response regulator transcription factor [Bacteroidales bacterium]
MKPGYKLLLVEDNANLSVIVKDYLEYSGFEVVACDNGQDAEKIFYKQRFDLLLLDIMIPYKNGLTLAEDIRKKDPNIPIIFLSARSLHEDRIKGFQAGGDDYITKPFNAEELLLRINSVLKRCKQAPPVVAPRPQGVKYQVGKYAFDPVKRTLIHENGNERILTGKECALLEMLCNDIDEVVMRDEALMTIWGENNYFVGRSMDVFITKLRKYLSDDPDIKITNLHGAGFKLEVD